jgi:hypothetical protein
MESVLALFLHIIVAVLIFSLLVWFVNLVTAMPFLVEPVKSIVRVLGIGLIVLLAISFLMGEIGFFGPVSWGWHRMR